MEGASSFCPECDTCWIDTGRGVIAGCEHRPPDVLFERLTPREKRLVTLIERGKASGRETQLR